MFVKKDCCDATALDLPDRLLLSFGRGLNGIYGDLLAVLTQALEPNNTGGLGEQGIILADAYVMAGMDVGAALPHQNVAGQSHRAI